MPEEVVFEMKKSNNSINYRIFISEYVDLSFVLFK